MKNRIIDYIKEKILPKFEENAIYGNYELSKQIYSRIDSIDEKLEFDLLIRFLINVQERLSINDNDINYLISMLESEIKLEKLIEEKKGKGYYDSEDLVLVRLSNFLPKDNLILSISNVPFVTKMGCAFSYALADYLKKDNKTCEEINNISDELSPFLTYYRSTIHFCLNGLVTDHQYGTFNEKFIIIEPFKYHENDTSLLAVRGEDTYFKESVEISKDAVIMVNELYKKDIELWEDKDKYKIVYYTGDKYIAVRMQLIKMGIVPEEVFSRYLKDSDTSSMITDYIIRNNYDSVSHSNSEIKEEDAMKTAKLNIEYEIQFYNYLLDYINDKSLRMKILTEIEKRDLNLFTLIPICEEIIEHLGIEKYMELVTIYNQDILNKIKQGNYPTNDELLNTGFAKK